MLDGKRRFRNVLNTKTIYKGSFCNSITSIALPIKPIKALIFKSLHGLNRSDELSTGVNKILTRFGQAASFGEGRSTLDFPFIHDMQSPSQP
jgi:hypothetical protein